MSEGINCRKKRNTAVSALKHHWSWGCFLVLVRLLMDKLLSAMELQVPPAVLQRSTNTCA
eukprot:scaffold222095_cov15-Tisochrysis_lutea.AAC.1